MNLHITLFEVSLLLVVCAAIGCGKNASFRAEGGGNGTSITAKIDATCYLSVKNQSLNAVVKTFAETMGATVVLAEGVDGATEVSTMIKADSWEQGLESLASDFDLRVEHDETSNTYTLAPR